MAKKRVRRAKADGGSEVAGTGGGALTVPRTGAKPTSSRLKIAWASAIARTRRKKKSPNHRWTTATFRPGKRRLPACCEWKAHPSAAAPDAVAAVAAGTARADPAAVDAGVAKRRTPAVRTGSQPPTGSAGWGQVATRFACGGRLLVSRQFGCHQTRLRTCVAAPAVVRLRCPNWHGCQNPLPVM